jgi:hypothetical protein
VAGEPLDPQFTPRERALGGCVAAALWTLSAALLALLAAWSIGPR